MPGAGTQSGPDAEPADIPVDPGGATGNDPADDAQDADEQDSAPDPEGPEGSDGAGGPLSLLHVPIKRKGRKR